MARRGFRSRMRRLLDAVVFPPAPDVYRHRVPKAAPAPAQRANSAKEAR